MPELGDASARAKPQSRRSFHETMAALISAIAPGTTGHRANGRAEPSADPAPVAVEPAPNFDYLPPELKKAPETVSNGSKASPEIGGNGDKSASETIGNESKSAPE